MTMQITIGGDLKVGRLGYGAMRLCGPGVMGYPRDRGNALAVLRRAVARGVTLIDTADAYGPAVNEEQIAAALYPYPAGLTIATKGGNTRPEGRWLPDGRPERLTAACEASLRRLRLERIDLYQWHAPDPKVPFADSIGALKGLRDAGKVRHIGLSNVSGEQLALARSIVPIVSVQNRYNLGARDSDDIVDTCERDGLAFIPYFPIDAGDLAKAEGALGAVAERRGRTPAQIALAWLLKRSPAIAPIPGTSTLEHLDENLDAASIVLSDEEFAQLSA
ncbi:MAG: aldo/keto reductase [Candidatus Eremiobacteraeota bacterium]|nr:aldo/keto reductase [Candidatus Eremiobacteraeota bacterium]